MTTTFAREWGFDLADLVAAEHLRPGSANVPATDREPVIRTLELMLFDRETKWRYLAELRRLCGGRFISIEPWTVERVEQILEQGLSALSNAELGELCLNPVAIGQIDDALGDEIPVGWEPASGRVGLRLLAEAGLQVPECPAEAADGSDVASQRYASMLRAGEVPPPLQSPSQFRRQFQIAASEIAWQGAATPPIEEPIEIDVDLAMDVLKVSIGGIPIGPQTDVRCLWRDAAGAILGEAQPANPYWLMCEFAVVAGRGILAQDRLEFEMRLQTSHGEVCGTLLLVIRE